MNTYELFRLAIGALITNRLRSLLTILGIVIGVASVVALVSFGQSFQGFVNTQFNALGSNQLFVFSTLPSGPNAKTLKAKPMTLADAEALANPQNVSGISAVAPTFTVSAKVSLRNNSTTVSVNGVTAAYIKVREEKLAAGRFITDEDVKTSARVAVLGPAMVTKLFDDGSDPIGQQIRVKDSVFTVVGVLKPQSGGFGSQDKTLSAPITTVQTRLGGDAARTASGEYRVGLIYLKATNDAAVKQAKIDIQAVLSERHEIKYKGDEDFTVFTQESILTTINSILSILTLFLGLIAGISLLVGGIGVMNIMLVSVSERTREIGLRKAVGAKYSDLLGQFLIESVTLCLVGGGIGVLIGAGFALVGRLLVPTLNLSVSTSAILLAVGVSTAIGVFFGLYPASRAAALKPIEALRYE